MKDLATIWEAVRYKTDEREGKTIFVVSPKWYEARQIAQTVLMAERHEITIQRCGAYVDPKFIAKRGHEVYVAQFSLESVFLGAMKL